MTTVSMTANENIDLAGMTLQGCTDLVDALTDADDYGYVISNDTTRIGVVGLTSPTLPAGAVIKSARTMFRGRAQSAQQGTIIAQFIPSGGTPTYASNNTFPISTAWATYTGSHQSTYRPSSQAELDTARLSISVTKAELTAANVSLIYVVVPVVTPTAITPDPVTSTTQPTLVWTRTLDGDGGTQTRYEVKVFTDAQYLAGGFNPATSTPFWASGEVLSSGASVTFPSLPNGDTYRAYIRIAQTVNGAAHWSAWAYDEFAIAVTTADVSTVVPVADNANARVGVTVTRGGATAWEIIEVQRSDDAGATWSYVRGAAYVDCTANANTFVVQDYESNNGATVRYRARATRTVTGSVITGSWVESTPITSWTSSSLWIKDPLNPSLNGTYRLETTVSPTYGLRSGVYDILGGDTPIVISDVRSAASGSLTLLATSKSVSTAILALARVGVVLIQPPATWDMEPMYVALGAAAQVRSKKVRTAVSRWTFPFTAVDAPADVMAGI